MKEKKKNEFDKVAQKEFSGFQDDHSVNLSSQRDYPSYALSHLPKGPQEGGSEGRFLSCSLTLLPTGQLSTRSSI